MSVAVRVLRAGILVGFVRWLMKDRQEGDATLSGQASEEYNSSPNNEPDSEALERYIDKRIAEIRSGRAPKRGRFISMEELKARADESSGGTSPRSP